MAKEKEKKLFHLVGPNSIYSIPVILIKQHSSNGDKINSINRFKIQCIFNETVYICIWERFGIANDLLFMSESNAIWILYALSTIPLIMNNDRISTNNNMKIQYRTLWLILTNTQSIDSMYNYDNAYLQKYLFGRIYFHALSKVTIFNKYHYYVFQ